MGGHSPAANAPAIPADTAGLKGLPRFTRVEVAGGVRHGPQFLLDNISHDGSPGYEVLSVLTLADGAHLLVNRGWVPFFRLP